MALATRCPNCHALFRVVADQLKLRGGLVRCGACHQVFDATSTLSYIDDGMLHSTSSSGPVTGRTEVASETLPPGDELDVARTGVVKEGVDGLARPPAHADVMPERTGVEAVTTGAADAAEFREASEPRPSGGSEAEAAEPGPEADQAKLAQPSFLSSAGEPARRGFPLIYGSGAAVLALLLLAQLATLFRAEILVQFPTARPALTQLCQVFRCVVNWPARGELLAVVGTELQQLPGTSALELTAVVRNRGSFTLAMPAIEVTLTDTQNRTVARKVFAPVDYLAGERDPSAAISAGLEAGADLTIRIAFEARGLNAAGFVVYPFYL